MNKMIFCSVIAYLTVIGCKTAEPDGSSEAKGLAVTTGASNIALLMTGMNKDSWDEQESLAATKRLREALAVLEPGGKFEIREFQNITKDELLIQTTKAAKDVGEGGTLFWYVATHGWTDGFAMKTGRVRAADLEKNLREARQGMPPFQRLFMLFDYCGSGGVVGEMKLTDGTGRPPRKGGLINLATASPDDMARAKTSGDDSFVDIIGELADGLSQPAGASLTDEGSATTAPLYRQALFFSPTSAMQETAGDTFTWTIGDVIKKNVTAKPDMTIGEFLKATADGIAENETEEFHSDAEEDYEMAPQTMVFRALPTDEILKDYLFKAGAPAATP